MDETVSPARAGRLLRLRWSIQALAQDADVQRTLFPGFACVADELALEFDECFRWFQGMEPEAGLRPEQLSLIQVLDSKIAAMSGPQNEALWSDEALGAANEWKDVRASARFILDRLGWPKVAPPSLRAVYVGPDA